MEDIERKKVCEDMSTTPRDCELVVECSNRGGDWKRLAESLGVNYQTAYSPEGRDPLKDSRKWWSQTTKTSEDRRPREHPLTSD